MLKKLISFCKRAWVIAFMAAGALLMGTVGYQNHGFVGAIGGGIVGTVGGLLASMMAEIGLLVVGAIIASLTG